MNLGGGAKDSTLVNNARAVAARRSERHPGILVRAAVMNGFLRCADWAPWLKAKKNEEEEEHLI